MSLRQFENLFELKEEDTKRLKFRRVPTFTSHRARPDLGGYMLHPFPRGHYSTSASGQFRIVQVYVRKRKRHEQVNRLKQDLQPKAKVHRGYESRKHFDSPKAWSMTLWQQELGCVPVAGIFCCKCQSGPVATMYARRLCFYGVEILRYLNIS